MTTRRKKPAEQAAVIADAAINRGGSDAVTGDRPDEAASVGFYPGRGATQVERIAALAAAREDGEKEGTIAGMAEAAAIAYRVHEGGGDDDGSLAATAGSEILAELHRRYPNDPRVTHHLKQRGLA